MNSKRLFDLIILSLILIFVSSSLFGAELKDVKAETWEEWEYEVDNVGEITITDYIGCVDTQVSIPSTINGMKVKCIGKDAFVNSILTDITIPDSVTTIEEFAFRYCKALKSITIPDGVTSIENGTFEYCDSLKTVKIPNGVTRIDKEAFLDCKELIEINLPDSLVSIGEEAFSGCSKLTNVSLPDSLEVIDYNAFKGCNINSIVIPKTVNKISGNIFGYCKNLESITISPDNETYNDGKGSNIIIETDSNTLISTCNGSVISDDVYKLGNYSFYGTNIKKIHIPQNVVTTDDFPFVDCSSIEEITVSDDNAFFNDGDGSNVLVDTIKKSIILGCVNSTIPESVTTIDAFSFSGCNKLACK